MVYPRPSIHAPTGIPILKKGPVTKHNPPTHPKKRGILTHPFGQTYACENIVHNFVGGE